MLADGGVGAGIGIERAEGDCFGDKMIFFYYIKLFVFFICQEDFFNHLAPTAVRASHLSIRRLEKELGCEVRLLFGRESRNKGTNRH